MGDTTRSVEKNEEKKVDECFQVALDLCDKEIQDKDPEQVDDRMKHTIDHIYHMYGTVLKNRIAMYTGQSLNDQPHKCVSKHNFQQILDWLIATAQCAASYFSKCRQYTPIGHENSLGYIGEITVRLQVCDFVQKHFEDKELKGLSGFLSQNARKRSLSRPTDREFVRQSLSTIDTLFMETFKFVGNDEVDHSIKNIMLWYNVLMRTKISDMDRIVSGNDIHAYRLQISVRKLKSGRKNSVLSKLEDISKPEDVE